MSCSVELRSSDGALLLGSGAWSSSADEGEGVEATSLQTTLPDTGESVAFLCKGGRKEGCVGGREGWRREGRWRGRERSGGEGREVEGEGWEGGMEGIRKGWAN